MTREEWLELGVEELTKRFNLQLGPVLVSVGWPKGGRKKIGQCWTPKASADEATAHVFVSPVIAEPEVALYVLLHELIHAEVGVEHKHGRAFSQRAKALGFTKPWTQSVPGAGLVEVVGKTVGTLPPYPHVQLNQEPPKQKTRMMLWECACEPPVKIRRAGDLNAQCLDCGSLFGKRDDG